MAFIAYKLDIERGSNEEDSCSHRAFLLDNPYASISLTAII